MAPQGHAVLVHSVLATYLVEEDGHEKVVDEERLRRVRVVVFEEEHRKHKDHVLLGGVSKRTTD